MERRRMVGLIAIVAIVAVTMFAGYVEELKYEGGAGKPTEPKNLEILDHRMETGEFGNRIIKVTAKNIGSSSLSYAEVRVKFYDKRGNTCRIHLRTISMILVRERHGTSKSCIWEWAQKM